MDFKVTLVYDVSWRFSYFDLTQVPSQYRARLNAMGIAFDCTDCQTTDEVISACRDSDYVVTTYAQRFFTGRSLDKLQKLKFVEIPGVGFDRSDVAALTEHGVGIVTHPGSGTDEIADTAMSLILAWSRKVLQLNRIVKAGKPEDVDEPWLKYYRRTIPRLMRLRGKTLGIIGLGNTGKALASRARSFGMAILGYDPYVMDQTLEDLEIGRASLDQLVSESDFISIHARLTEETRNLISAEQLRRMKPDVFIVNTARGAIIDEAALCSALLEGGIGGVGLDVTANEPVDSGSPLLKLDNVILTGHVGGCSEKAEPERWSRPLEEIARVVNRQWPMGLQNPAMKPRYVEKWGPMSEPGQSAGVA